MVFEVTTTNTNFRPLLTRKAHAAFEKSPLLEAVPLPPGYVVMVAQPSH